MIAGNVGTSGAALLLPRAGASQLREQEFLAGYRRRNFKVQ